MELIDAFTVPVISGTGGATTSGGSQVFTPELPPPEGLTVVTGITPAVPPTTSAAGGPCCDRCRKGGGGSAGQAGAVVVASTGSTVAGPLTAAARGPLPWWVYVLVGFAVGRLFRG